MKKNSIKFCITFLCNQLTASSSRFLLLLQSPHFKYISPPTHRNSIMPILRCQLTSVFCAVAIPLEAAALQLSWKTKNQHFSMSGQGRERLLLRCKKHKEKGITGDPSPPQETSPGRWWQERHASIYSCHIHPCVYIVSSWEHRKQRFYKTQELNLDSAMNVKFQVTEKSTNPREQPGKYVMKCVSHITCIYAPSLLFCCAYSEDKFSMK